MKTEAIKSQQNFNGNLYFITANGEKVSELRQFSHKLLPNQVNQVKTKLINKPYDLFVSESREISGFIELQANVLYENILNKKTLIEPVFMLAHKPDRFVSSAEEAMSTYERSATYAQDTKPENVFKKVWHKLKSKNQV